MHLLQIDVEGCILVFLCNLPKSLKVVLALLHLLVKTVIEGNEFGSGMLYHYKSIYSALL